MFPSWCQVLEVCSHLVVIIMMITTFCHLSSAKQPLSPMQSSSFFIEEGGSYALVLGFSSSELWVKTARTAAEYYCHLMLAVR